MNLIEFSIKLGSITSKSGIKAAICDFITNHSIEYNKEKIKEHISNLPIEAFTSYGNNLGICRNHCLEEKSKTDNQSDSDYLRELQEVIDFLSVLSEIYQEINTEREKAKKLSDESSAIEQQKDVLREIQENIKVFKSEIEDSKKDIKRANDSFNDKISSLLINTVAILGIFVTIAFAGFGVVSIFFEH